MVKSKLFYIQWANGFGGLEKITYDYENLFSDYNPVVILFEYRKIGIKYKDYHFIDKRKKLYFFYNFSKFILGNKRSIFHYQIPQTWLLLLTYFLGARKIICQFHGTYTPKNFIQRRVWAFLSNRIQIIANSQHTKGELLIKYGITKNITVIPNLINQNEFKFKERSYNSEQFVVTYAGRLAEGKNLFLLLEIIKLLQNEDSIEFRIFGDGPVKEKLIEKVDELSIKEKVSIQPFSKDISKIYHESHLLIFLSLFETFGNVVAEAVLTGLPVLCYRIPSLTELVKDETFFVREKNPKIIADRIVDMKKNYFQINKKIKIVNEELNKYLDNKRIMTAFREMYNK